MQHEDFKVRDSRTTPNANQRGQVCLAAEKYGNMNLRPGNYSFKLEWMDKSADFCEENEDDQVVIECFCEKRTV